MTVGDCQSTVLKGVVCKLLLFRIIGVMFPSICLFHCNLVNLRRLVNRSLERGLWKEHLFDCNSVKLREVVRKARLIEVIVKISRFYKIT